MKTHYIVLLFIMAFINFSCQDNDDTSTNGALQITFDNRVSTTTDLTMNIDSFTNSSGETISVTELKYIISNIVLIDENDVEYVYPKSESYRIINELDPNSLTLNLTNIPAKKYTKIRFGIGVDPTEYPLDQLENFVPQAEEAGMLWAWAAGYKFIKFEGNYSLNGGNPAPFIYHIGSHGTTQDNFKTTTLTLPVAAEVSTTVTPEITIIANIAEIFDGTTTVSLTTADNVQVDPTNAPIIATNFSTIFTIETVQN